MAEITKINGKLEVREGVADSSDIIQAWLDENGTSIVELLTNRTIDFKQGDYGGNKIYSAEDNHGTLTIKAGYILNLLAAGKTQIQLTPYIITAFAEFIMNENIQCKKNINFENRCNIEQVNESGVSHYISSGLVFNTSYYSPDSLRLTRTSIYLGSNLLNALNKGTSDSLLDIYLPKDTQMVFRVTDNIFTQGYLSLTTNCISYFYVKQKIKINDVIYSVKEVINDSSFSVIENITNGNYTVEFVDYGDRHQVSPLGFTKTQGQQTRNTRVDSIDFIARPSDYEFVVKATTDKVEIEFLEPLTQFDGQKYAISIWDDTNTIEVIAFSNVLFDVDTITNITGDTWRYTMNGSPDLSNISIGDKIKVTTSTNLDNNGKFVVTAVDDISDYIEVTNVSGAEELTNSPAQLQELVYYETGFVTGQYQEYKSYSVENAYLKIN